MTGLSRFFFYILLLVVDTLARLEYQRDTGDPKTYEAQGSTMDDLVAGRR